MTVAEFLLIDLPALMVATLTCVSCGLLGNFLLLRRQALMGDALSHVVLPGIVVAYLVTGTIASTAMLLGAFGAAVLAVMLIEAVRRFGHVEPGAAMGVVFTAMFAGGVVLLEQSTGGAVHLDVQHALYGNLEATLWLGPSTWVDLLDPGMWAVLPAEAWLLIGVTAVTVAVIVLFYKELKISSFDPGLANSLGFPTRWIGLGLMVLVGAAAVAAFQAVGSILVIATFICPPATARMLTDRLSRQILLSAVFAVSAAVLGYILAAFGPFWVGLDNSLNAAGMIAVVAGVQQALAMLFAPRYGVVARRRRRRVDTVEAA